MSGASAAASDGGLAGSPAASRAQSSAQAQQRWTGSTPLKVTWAVLEAITVAAFCAGAIASGSLVAAVIVPVALIPLAIVSWYRFWRTSLELTADGTVVVRTVLRTHHIPVVQIFRMRRSEYGIRITLIDGRIVTAGVLQTGLWRRRSSRPDQAASAISAITRAIEAARSAQPAETTAAINSRNQQLCAGSHQADDPSPYRHGCRRPRDTHRIVFRARRRDQPGRASALDRSLLHDPVAPSRLLTAPIRHARRG
jgi:hypothetical protein